MSMVQSIANLKGEGEKQGSKGALKAPSAGTRLARI